MLPFAKSLLAITEEIKFIDYKNLKDVELHKYRYCCSPGQQLILQADAVQTIQPRRKANMTARVPEVSIRHPDVEEVESIIRASCRGQLCSSVLK